MTPKQKRSQRRQENAALDSAAGRKKPKLLSVARAKKKLWALLAEYVRTRDARMGGVCVTCLKSPIESANHIIPRQDSLNTAFDPENLYGGCSSCNRLELRFRSKWARIVFPQIFGQEKMAMLTERSRIKVKWGRSEFAAKIAEAERLLGTLTPKSVHAILPE